jgi:2,4-dienoyl-CoA reductase-like NADH-dependent reductase (Old Yellow Enzyme family)
MVSREKSIVFSSGRIGKLELKNRLVRSATYENAGSGTGGVTVTPRQIRIDGDDCITGLQRIPKVVRDTADDCKIMTQLHHPGITYKNKNERSGGLFSSRN